MQWSVIPTDVFYTMRFSAYSFCVMLFVQSEVPNDQDISAYAAQNSLARTHAAAGAATGKRQRRAASEQKRALRERPCAIRFMRIPFVGHDL